MGGELLDTNQANLPGNPAQTLPAATGNNFIQNILNNPQQRLYAIIAAVVLVAVVLGFIFLGKNSSDNPNKGKPVALVQELDQSRAFEIVAKLKSVNIDAKIVPSEKPGEYTITVYDNAIESAYLALSRTNLLEDEGYGLFDQNDWAASDYDKRIKLIRAINGDLSRIISRMEGLRTAIVRVNMPEQEIFSDVQATTTATVQIEMENDADEISKTQVKSIVNILRGYVPNLAKDQISIVDTQGRNYSSFKTDDDADADDYIDEVDRINKSISKRIETYLDGVLGHDRYKVSVSAKISREKVETQATRYTPGAVSTRQTAKEEMNSSGSNSGKNYKQNNKTETMYPNFEQQNVTYMPGRVTDVTVALAVDKSVPATMSLKQLQESVAAIVGPSIPVDNIKMTVVDLYTSEDQVMESQKPKGFWTIFTQGGGVLGIVGKILAGIGILFVLLIAAVIGLNLIGAAGRSNTELETDPNLNKEYEDIFPTTADEAYAYDDFGEQQAIAQQEALLKEMSKPAPSSETQANVSGQQIEFDSLLSGLQSTAKTQPDALAKKIQVWLDED